MLLTKKRIEDILHRIKDVRIAVYGDFCLDVYWIMDPDGSEISVETGLKAEAVKKQYYSPGGAANIVANLSALEPAEIKVIGIIGDDLFGRELKAQLSSLHADISSLITQKHHFDTYAFTKKYINNEEEPRIDFGVFNERSVESDKKVLKYIREALEDSDALLFNQQIPGSITNPDFIEEVNQIFGDYKEKIVLLDSRHYNNKFSNVFRKINQKELVGLVGIQTGSEDHIPISTVTRYVQELFQSSGKPVFVTCGERGIVTEDEKGTHTIEGLSFLTKPDPVGAGDTTLSALALALAAGIRPHEAAEFANLAAGVTVQKLFTTGTATGREILDLARDPDFSYNPDLSEQISLAKYIKNTKIEICTEEEVLKNYSISYVLFDHDGTLSILRSGWEPIMEKFMIDAITGGDSMEANTSVYEKVRQRVKEYIDKSTGVQTIVQMQALVEMVVAFDLVTENSRLNAHGYKKLFNDALMEMVEVRKSDIDKGKNRKEVFILPGVLELLYALQEKEIKMYLASGTDQDDVVKEASLLGYADFFEGRIFGSVGDITKYSKKQLITSIIKENSLSGQEILVIGDGPVEIRECKKRGGLTIGIASDELHPGRLNLQKRSRLIKAGAHFIIPDFMEIRKFFPLFD